MPSNTPEYQKKYRETYNKRIRNVTVGVPVPLYNEFQAFAFLRKKVRLHAHILRRKNERGTLPKVMQSAGLTKITKTWHLVSGFRSTT